MVGRIISKHLPPFSAAFLRYLIASLALLFIVWKRKGGLPRINKNQILAVSLLGLFGIFSYSYFFFRGLKTVEAGRASVIVATNPIFISLLSAALFQERLRVIQILGIALSVAGAVLVITKGHFIEVFGGNIGQGEFFIFMCVVCWVIYTLIGKRVLQDMTPLVSVMYASIIGCFALGITALQEGILQFIDSLLIVDWMGLLYLGLFGTVLGFVWYNEGVYHIGPTRASQFINLIPITSIGLGFLILGEDITFSLVIGSVLVISGVYLTNRFHREIENV